jgi:hypothetical protein
MPAGYVLFAVLLAAMFAVMGLRASLLGRAQ